jgi:hypothetical protein
MDIWDVSRVLIRRWYLSLPLLLLTAAVTVLTASYVRPDYVGTTHVSLLPPVAQRSPVDGQTMRVNPWDTERLTTAVIVRLNTKSLADQVQAEGLTGVWEAGLDQNYNNSIIRIEVTSPTPAQARLTMARLLREVDDEVMRQQIRYPGLTPEDKITTTRLDLGMDVVADTGNVKRAVVVVCLVGLLLTTAVTLSVDALLRRRARRRQPEPTRIWHEAATAVRRPDRQVPMPVNAPMSPSPDAEATQPVVRITNVPLQMPTAGAAPKSDALNPDDSTIVLPLSNAPWAQPPKRVTGTTETAGPAEATGTTEATGATGAAESQGQTERVG